MKRIGIVGLGKMGILHSGIINCQPNASVKAICEKDRLLLRLVRSLLPKTISLYEDHLKMAENEDLDAVFITTPFSTHVQLILDLVGRDRDLSIFVEKPLASSFEQAQAACEAASRSRGTQMVGFQKRFSPVFQRARDLVAKGAIGDPMFFRAYSFSSDVLREGKSWRFRRETGGVLLDLAPHLVDMLLWFFGEPEAISAVKKSLYSSEVEDYVHAVFSFRSGMKGHMDICWSMASFRLPEILIEVNGKNGSLTVTDDFVKLAFHGGSGVISQPAEVHYKQSFDTSVSFLLADPEYAREDEAFLSAIDGRCAPHLDFSMAATVNGIIDRIVESAGRAGVR